MKATVVPAQVTTVEDKVAGNLNFMQLILFALPIFGGSLLYAVLPPSMEAALYKLVIICTIAIVSLMLAIRIKGKIILLWLVILLRYQSRPRYYLFNKNSARYRESYKSTQIVKPAAVATSDEGIVHAAKLVLQERTIASQTIDDPLSKVRFETNKKGGLYVHLSEIKE